MRAILTDEADATDAVEQQLGPRGRAHVFRERAAALEDQLARAHLPRLQEKLRSAADRFLELAAAEERVAERSLSGTRERRADLVATAIDLFANEPFGSKLRR